MQLQMSLPKNHALIMSRRLQPDVKPHPVVAKSARSDSPSSYSEPIYVFIILQLVLLVRGFFSFFSNIKTATKIAFHVSFVVIAVIIQDAVIGVLRLFLDYQLQGVVCA